MASKKEISPVEKSMIYGEHIAYELAEWTALRDGTKECVDPFWEDGINMNLCRNHILYYHGRIEEELLPALYPKEYSIPIPEEYPSRYISGLDTLIACANGKIERIQNMPSYLELLQCGYAEQISLDQKKKDSSYYNWIMSDIANFQKGIPLAEEELLNYDVHSMKRYDWILTTRRYARISDKSWNKRFMECLKKIQATYPELQVNLPAEESKDLEDIAPVEKVTMKRSKKVSSVKQAEMIPDELEHQFTFFELGLFQ